MRLLLFALFSVVATRPVAAQSAELTRMQRVSPGFAVAGHETFDLDADGDLDLLVVGRSGEVRTFAFDAKTGRFADAAGTLRLADPARTLVALVDLLGSGAAPQLVVVRPDGVWLRRADARGVFGGEGRRLSGRARFRLRVGWPRFADFVQDANGDGKPDLVIPRGGTCSLWLHDRVVDGVPTFRSAGEIRVTVGASRQVEAKALSDRLTESLTIPRLNTRDLNGDGRPDLIVENERVRHFHVQADDGTFPDRPTATLDLDLFRDTTPRASMRPGRTLAGGDLSTVRDADLDGDSIRDFVIAHRRKVWVFHGTAAGPQFKRPTVIFRVHDDVTGLFVLKLDDDRRPDLLILKVQVPTVGTLLLGLLGQWDVEIAALGYRNRDGKRFESDPVWKSELRIRLPSLMSLMRDPESILERFLDVGSEFRTAETGDLDGDSGRDAIVVSQDSKSLEAWLGKAGTSSEDGRATLGSTVRNVFFEDKNRVWSLDRILGWVRGLARDRIEHLTGGRAPDTKFAMLDPDAFRLRNLELVDFDRKSGSEVLLSYEERSTGRAVFELVRLVSPDR